MEVTQRSEGLIKCSERRSLASSIAYPKPYWITKNWPGYAQDGQLNKLRRKRGFARGILHPQMRRPPTWQFERQRSCLQAVGLNLKTLILSYYAPKVLTTFYRRRL